MHSLNDIICGITKDDNLDISLWEDNGSEISDVLIKNKLNYNIIDKNDKLVPDASFIKVVFEFSIDLQASKPHLSAAISAYLECS